jgi:hypothetical protein
VIETIEKTPGKKSVIELRQGADFEEFLGGSTVDHRPNTEAGAIL